EVSYVRVGARETLRHEEQVIAVVFDLRPLIEVRAVLDGERVKVKPFAQELERRVVLIREIDPAHDAFGRRSGGLGAVGRVQAPRGVELEHAERRHGYSCRNAPSAGAPERGSNR